MQILTVDIGTGTQDIYLFRSGLSLENGYKLVMPSPTMLIRSRIQAATRRGEDLLFTGVTVGGGPCAWAAEAHLRSGARVYATADAARTFNDDLDWVHNEMGVEIVSEDETARLRDVTAIRLREFDLQVIATAFGAFDLALDPAAVAIAVFDHGAAPPDESDRSFRFRYLADQIRERNSLTAFAFPSARVPAFLTRMQAIVASASDLACPVVVMDTAPAAVLGATLDPRVAAPARKLVANIGNFHALAFRLGPGGIEALFEHHTGLLDVARLDALLTALADGSLTNTAVFDSMGHGAIVFDPEPLGIDQAEFGVAVTGPRRSMLRDSRLKPLFAAPHGDMMIAGCLGLLLGVAELHPELAEPILAAFAGAGQDAAPWDVD